MAATADEIYADLLDHSDYAEVGSLSRARKFVTLCTQFLIAHPQSQSDQGSSMTMSIPQIENLLRQAQQYVAAKSAVANGTSVRFLSAAEGFRR